MSTAADYHRFTQMLPRGGELDGVRLLGPRTVAYMTRNHLPGGVDLEAFGRPVFAETTVRGVGFGLGFSVVVDPAAGKVLTSVGRVRLGRAGQHRVLGRPGRGDHRDVLHPADAVEHLPDPPPAAHAGRPRRWWTDGASSSAIIVIAFSLWVATLIVPGIDGHRGHDDAPGSAPWSASR